MESLINDQMVEIGGAFGIDDINWDGLLSDSCGMCYKEIKDYLGAFDGSYEQWLWIIGAIFLGYFNAGNACGACINKLIEGI